MRREQRGDKSGMFSVCFADHQNSRVLLQLRLNLILYYRLLLHFPEHLSSEGILTKCYLPRSASSSELPSKLSHGVDCCMRASASLTLRCQKRSNLFIQDEGGDVVFSWLRGILVLGDEAVSKSHPNNVHPESICLVLPNRMISMLNMGLS